MLNFCAALNKAEGRKTLCSALALLLLASSSGAAVLAPFFLDLTPEVRSTYQSLGKIVEDRPMQITNVRVGWDSGAFGRFGIRNWDVSSLTDRRADVHRHFLYHTEFGPTWDCALKLADGWSLKNDITCSWTIFDGFEKPGGNRTYNWWQIDQSLENGYLVPFYRIRRCVIGNDYLYYKVGVRRKWDFGYGISVTPSVFFESGNSRNMKRVFGQDVSGGSVSFRLEAGWKFAECCTAFAYVEQYDVVGSEAREANDKLNDPCAHNDWFHGGVGLRFRF